MRTWLISLIACSALNASSITAPLLDVNGTQATVASENLRTGMSGFILRTFDTEHSTIIANARVEKVDQKLAILKLSEYDGLKQKALPGGNWVPKSSDLAVIAYDYERALMIAPSDDTYDTLTKGIHGVEWIHPDNFAAYLSNEGHPTPLVEDFKNYCTANSVGLLYIQTAQNLFTLDCKSFTLLEHTPANASSDTVQTPFYSRIPLIRASWWGKGSSRLERYEPYYLEQIILNNAKNKDLYELTKAKFSEQSALLRIFDVKE
ncbi:MAG: plasminogen-binding N-terminal domain-containing protein [Sulfuricurvum sp.]|nr:plasminogen-binding N-terminal domain-containing protein [Sulfuricurvum sp.]